MQKEGKAKDAKIEVLSSEVSQLRAENLKLAESLKELETHRNGLLEKVERLHADKHKLENRLNSLENARFYELSESMCVESLQDEDLDGSLLMVDEVGNDLGEMSNSDINVSYTVQMFLVSCFVNTRQWISFFYMLCSRVPSPSAPVTFIVCVLSSDPFSFLHLIFFLHFLFTFHLLSYFSLSSPNTSHPSLSPCTLPTLLFPCLYFPLPLLSLSSSLAHTHTNFRPPTKAQVQLISFRAKHNHCFIA